MNEHVRDLLVSTRPTVKVGGEVDHGLLRDIDDMEIRDDGNGTRRLRLRLIATGPRGSGSEGMLYLDGKVIDFGKDISVAIGPHDRQKVAFEGRISAIEAVYEQGENFEVELRAEDRLFDLATTRRSRTFERVTAEDIVRQIASAHNLGVETDLESPQFDLVQQWNETDLSFLRRRLSELDADLWLAGGKLFAKDRDKRRPNALTLHIGAEILSLFARADLADQRSAITVGGFDPARNEPVEEESAEVDVASLTRGGRSGIAILSSTFGERKTARRSGAVPRAGEARTFAKAAHRQRTRRFVVLDAITTGLPDLDLGSRLTLNGIGEMFGGGGYSVTALTHLYDRVNGFRTLFAAERGTVGGGA